MRRAMGRPLPVGRVPPSRRATVAPGAREARVRVGRAARVALVIDKRVGHAAPAGAGAVPSEGGRKAIEEGEVARVEAIGL